MNYEILNENSALSRESALFFTTDRTIGRDSNMLCKLLDVEEGRFARPHQTHTDRILRIDKRFFSLTEEEREAQMEGIDAVISDVHDAVIGISTADCIPVLVYDKEHDVAAAIHAGWRGTVQRIAEKAILSMESAISTRPEACCAVIGPGISLASFEVGDEVYDAFINAGFDLTSAAVHTNKWHIDLKEVNRQQLLSSGIKAENITVSDIDTFTNEVFFSARREQKGDVKCGRILSGFVLR